jgi:formylglycine-generating enzyme required for sulfatase activity
MARSEDVGTKAANELGIHDMSGNVWEWCEDIAYGPTRRFYGGSWNYGADNSVVGVRGIGGPDTRIDFHGFRLARNSGL